jgi:hypothetical protein
MKVRAVGDFFFLIESQSRRLSGRTALVYRGHCETQNVHQFWQSDPFGSSDGVDDDDDDDDNNNNNNL